MHAWVSSASLSFTDLFFFCPIPKRWYSYFLLTHQGCNFFYSVRSGWGRSFRLKAKNTRQESSMIHSASPLSRPAVIFAWFWSFGTDGRTDNMCENSDHYRPGLWSASWINFICSLFFCGFENMRGSVCGVHVCMVRYGYMMESLGWTWKGTLFQRHNYFHSGLCI